MALITGSDAFDSTFSPVAGDFVVQVSGKVQLIARCGGSGAFEFADMLHRGFHLIANPVAGVEYQFKAPPAGGVEGVTVKAHQ